VGFSEPLTQKHLASHLHVLYLADEAKAETPERGVPWSLPSEGITGDLGGSLLIYLIIKG